ncbi:MAG: hypothetical protein Ct9H90mP27_5070 [Gammaproteobacteria bacterium]|nr:MAG: hypothetical protein Ct9H90mP27_5070 [Gammaproteobacteria bacterium]
MGPSKGFGDLICLFSVFKVIQKLAWSARLEYLFDRFIDLMNENRNA